MARLTADDLLGIDRELAGRSLSDFVRMAWPVLEPGKGYLHNWHIDAVCAHLEAVARQDLTRLLINVPPGTMKSLLVSVCLPAWLWGPFGWPAARILSASHTADLATRDARRSRMLIESPWYQARWPVKIARDQNQKTCFENTARGFRQATSVSGMTGRRGDLVIWDDPHSAEGANSEAERETAIRVLTETIPTRVNDPTRSPIVIIMQRLHERDVSGHILAQDLGYEHLMLPMEYEPERRCVTSIGFADPRTVDGELLHPKRYPPEAVERDRLSMGSYGWAGQMQQRPAPRGGGLFRRDWFRVVLAPHPGTVFVRGWDLAASTSSAAAWTAGALLGRQPDGTFVLADMRRIQGSPAEVKRLLVATAAEDVARWGAVRGSLPQDPGAAGKAWSQDLVRALAGHAYRATPETGSKLTRAEPVAAQAEAGNMALVEAPWTRAFLDEAESFPMGKFVDQVDALSRAFMVLAERRSFRWFVAGEWFDQG